MVKIEEIEVCIYLKESTILADRVENKLQIEILGNQIMLN